MGLSPPLRVGVLLALPVQLLDMSAVDLFGMLTEEYLKSCNLPKPITDIGRDVEIHYIGSANGETSVNLTANAKLLTTNTIEDEAVAAGKLNVLMIPGPDPASLVSQEVRRFVKDHNEAGTTLLVICTGAFVAGQSGVLKGKKASGPRALVPKLKKLYPDTKWDSSRRFVADGNIWSSGGITNGHDMTAAYIKMLYPGPLSETICALADVGTRGETYASSNATDNMWWLFQIIRAAITKPFRGSKP